MHYMYYSLSFLITLLLLSLYSVLLLPFLPTLLPPSPKPSFLPLSHYLPVLPYSTLSPFLSILSLPCSTHTPGRRLGGPPLCYSSCGQCLAIWGESSKLPDGVIVPETVGGRAGCGYANGKVETYFISLLSL